MRIFLIQAGTKQMGGLIKAFFGPGYFLVVLVPSSHGQSYSSHDLQPPSKPENPGPEARNSP